MKSFITKDGKYTVTRCSRWIQIRRKYDIRKNNVLYDFSTDGYGYKPADERYDPSTGTYLDYFRFDGRNYAIEQFICLGSVWCPEPPYEFTDVDGRSAFVSAVDFSGNLFNPYYIELDEYGEKVRVYTVERSAA